MKFEHYPISPKIKRSLEESGFKRPTDIQHRAIKPILEGEDVFAVAQTGTGKTAAFAIPVIERCLQSNLRQESGFAFALVLSPTRELAMQTADVFRQLAKYTDVKITLITGGIEQDNQISDLKKGTDILVATPGRVFDLISQKVLSLRKTLVLVLDEADKMLDLGFLKDLQTIVTFVHPKRQTLFFSATLRPDIKETAYSLVKKAYRIQISPKDPITKNVEHCVAFVAQDDKRFFLERIIKDNFDNKFMVFVRTKVRAERVVKAMERVGLKTLVIHGDKEQAERSKAISEFKAGMCNVLIATDVSARGIDVAGVNFVINYDMPDVAENYVHRIGRTGRGTQRGKAISFCSQDEKELLEQIENFIGKEIRILEIDAKTYEETLDLTEDTNQNWKSLLDDLGSVIERQEKAKKKKKR
jgi:ATP-dependent RNA helicase RhlE